MDTIKVIANKSYSIQVLKKYFSNFEIEELFYYLDTNLKDIRTRHQLENFLYSNTYDDKNNEFENYFKKYFRLIIKNIFDMIQINTNEFKEDYDIFETNIMRGIKFSIINESIYWENIFSISNIIFIKHSYIENFDKIEPNTNSVEFKKFIFEMTKNILMILINTKNVCDCITKYINSIGSYKCVKMSDIKFNQIKKSKILKEPGLCFDKILMYSILSKPKKFYAILNVICSDLDFSPYWDEQIVEFEYDDINNMYVQTNTNSNFEGLNGLDGLEGIKSLSVLLKFVLEKILYQIENSANKKYLIDLI